MGKLFKNIGNFITAILAIGIIFCIGYWAGDIGLIPKGEVVNDSGDDVKLPGEVERRVVTVEEVESKLFEIGELSTYAGDFTVTLGKDETRYLLENIKLPWTTNSIEITCSGIVKVGYNLSDIKVRVDDDKIYISTPEPKINDSYVIWDTIQCTEKNNISNPIQFSQYQEIIDEIEKKGVADVEANGIYDKAEENLKTLISAFLSEFTDYRIIYM